MIDHQARRGPAHTACRAIALLAAGCAAMACAAPPGADARPPDPSARPQPPGRYTLAANGLAAPAAQAPGGTLPQLVALALSRYPALRAQQRQREAAQAGVEGARWQFYPTPVVSLERSAYGSGSAGRHGDEQVLTVGLRQTLWSGGRLTNNLDKAGLRVVLAEADLEILRQQIALRVVQHWSEALAAQDTVRAYAQSRATHERLLDMVRRRAAEGASPEADVQLAQSRLDAVAADLDAARSRRDTALARIAVLVGQDIPQGLLALAPAPPLEGDTETLRRQAHAISPQLARAEVQVRLAQLEIEGARAAMMPEVYVRAERQYGNFNQRGAPPENRVLLGVSTAFGPGLSNLSAVDAAGAQYGAALEDARTQRLTLDEQVTTDFTQARSSGQRRIALQAARQSAGTVSQSWERQFLAGRKQWQDLMNAAREQAQTDAQLAETIGAEQLTRWRLRVLTQGVDALFQP
ncbi:MAG: TolC family protein [Bordetella sp.]|nr:TolC family protein [Bordetella sp.]